MLKHCFWLENNFAGNVSSSSHCSCMGPQEGKCRDCSAASSPHAPRAHLQRDACTRTLLLFGDPGRASHNPELPHSLSGNTWPFCYPHFGSEEPLAPVEVMGEHVWGIPSAQSGTAHASHLYIKALSRYAEHVGVGEWVLLSGMTVPGELPHSITAMYRLCTELLPMSHSQYSLSLGEDLLSTILLLL